MKISPTKVYAVITGDVVASSRLSKSVRRALPDHLKRASREVRKAFGDAVPLEIDVFRGDSWQLLITDPLQCLRIALFLRSRLISLADRGRGLDTRLAIAIGPVDFVPAGAVSEGDGEAYRLSGRLLETLPTDQLLTLGLTTAEVPATIAAAIRLLDAVVQNWTGKQAEAVAGALRGWTQEKIAASWPQTISQPAVTKHLSKAHWPAVEAALRQLESAVRPLLGR
jgi:hypothetical protein